VRPQFYRVSIVVIIIGLAFIGRGIGMDNAVFFWIGVSLAGANIVLLLSSYCRSASGGTHGKPTSPDTAN